MWNNMTAIRQEEETYELKVRQVAALEHLVVQAEKIVEKLDRIEDEIVGIINEIAQHP
jgi:hypothetical protein